MGNSQSLDKVQHVVSEGISIYQKVKKQQEQEEQQQHHYQQTTTTTTYTHQSSSHYVASPNIDDDQEYSQLRAKAHEEAEKRNNCYAESQEAYKSGDGARGKTANRVIEIILKTFIIAKELSNQGHHHDNLMKQYNQQAANHIYSSKYIPYTIQFTY